MIQQLTGGRLHLSHGPIDVVLKAYGAPSAVADAYAAAARRFPAILPELCAELPLLRTPMAAVPRFDRDGPTRSAASDSSPLRGEGRVRGQRRSPPLATLPSPGRFAADLSPEGRGGAPGPVVRSMLAACLPFADIFITPMAAVAGAVADELLAAMRATAPLDRAYVNDGGDIAVFCAPGQALDIGIAGDFRRGRVPSRSGAVCIRHGDGIGGIATSGARGRSFSLGIADSVTVLAESAAAADAAATLIANAVDCDDPVIERRPAVELDPDSDLGERLVTVRVGPLAPETVTRALTAGLVRAEEYRARGLLIDAAMTLQGETLTLPPRPPRLAG